MSNELQSAVFAFIQNERRCKPHEIALDRSLNLDLGMDGDDAVEFFEAFAEKFGVDLTELGEEWSRYFGPEGFGLFGSWPQVLTLFSAPAYGPILPMRIARVVKAAESGRWEKLKNDTEA
jgi:Protein of unknown function (DUF1493)